MHVIKRGYEELLVCACMYVYACLPRWTIATVVATIVNDEEVPYIKNPLEFSYNYTTQPYQ